MATSTDVPVTSHEVFGSNQAVALMHRIVGGLGYSSEGWRVCWEEGVTPWDQGQPTPAIIELVNSGALPNEGATVLVPGCGGGYDVVALSGPGRFVYGLDICEAAIGKAKQRTAADGGEKDDNKPYTFVVGDFFTWEPPEKNKLDLIFDYTFFIALHPSLRPAWAKRVAELLKPDGELITLMYLLEGQDGGPPFNNSVLDYEEVLNPLGFVINGIKDNEVAVAPRKGMEKIARWKRMAA